MSSSAADQANFPTMIIPRAFLEKTRAPLVPYLDEHYARTDLEKFVIWDLRNKKTEPSTQRQ